MLTNLSDEVILKAGMQLNLLQSRILLSKFYEVSKVKDEDDSECQCLTSKLQTELCYKFSMIENLTHSENEMYSLIPMFTLNIDEGKLSAVNAGIT